MIKMSTFYSNEAILSAIGPQYQTLEQQTSKFTDIQPIMQLARIISRNCLSKFGRFEQANDGFIGKLRTLTRLRLTMTGIRQ